MSVLRRIRAWLMDPGAHLSRRVAHGGVWAFLINVLNRGLQLLRTVVLARLLAPEDFGLFGITVLALSALERLTETGFDAALIQKQDDDQVDLDTAWAVQIMRGVLLGALLLVGAPFVASFFEEPGAAALVRVLAAVSILTGLRNIGVIRFRKDIEFHKEFIFKLTSTLPDLIASVVAALILRSAWALVIGLVAGRLVQTVASYFLHSYRPSLRFDLSAATDLFNFGKYITAQSVVLFLLTEGDDALVGKVLGTTALGFYQIAYQLSNAAATQITHVISGVTFPAYSKLQEAPDKMNRGLLRTLTLTSFLALPIAGALGVLAHDVTAVFLGEKWLPMVAAMQVMCLFGAMRALAATFGPIYRAVARVDIPLKVNLTQLVLLAMIVYPLTIRWGILGTSVAITFTMAVALIHTSVQISRVTGLTVRQLYKPVLPPLVATLAAGVQTHFLAEQEMLGGPVVELVTLLSLGAVCYLAVSALCFRSIGYSLDRFRLLLDSMLGQAR